MDMLKVILDIEKKAQKITSSYEEIAHNEKEKTLAYIKEFEKKEEQKVNEKISVFSKQCEKELKEELKTMNYLMAEKRKTTEWRII